MDKLVRRIISDSVDQFLKDIDIFQENYGTRTTFEELNNEQLREQLWRKLFSYLSDEYEESIHHKCLSTLRMLSRDKMNLNELVTDQRLDIVLDNALLKNTSIEKCNYNKATTEALKLLCNLIFNSTKVQQIIPMTSYLNHLIERMKYYNDTTPYDIMLFDVRTLFLITALNTVTRQIVKNDLKGDECLIKMLGNISIHGECDRKHAIKTENEMLVCEALKALFNLYISLDDTVKEEEKIKSLVATLYKLLLAKCEKEDDLQSNIVNLLTVIPYECYSTIIPNTKEKHKQVFQNADMSAMSVLLKFLDRRLNCNDDLIASLSPIITAFIRMSKSERLIRKYVRLQILPPLKDVMHRPEEGTTLRAKLCKLLTSPLTELRDLVAEFLFILCKENVSRMVKYTGYGNAAGMFANKGLLGSNKKGQMYSSESEDSETEEYIKHKEQINPVTGCYEQPKANPLEGMTEEQKEYEALQLVGLVDKLTRAGVVHPCRIGDDGKPKPIEHVLELQEALPKQQYNHQNSDSE